MRFSICQLVAVAAFAFARFPLALAADNVLSPRERDEGWVLLFDGQTLDGWATSSEQPSRRPVEDGTLNPHGCGGYMLVHRQTWENFVLALDFKISAGCNSGVFFRTYSLQPRPGKDVGFNGLEVAIDDTQQAGFHDTGAIYDLVAPRQNAMRPAGQWNHLVLTCNGNRVDVELNGEHVTHMDLAEWTRPFARPDGTAHKFDIAYRDHPRRGYIGLQDHGADCWFKNLKLKPLVATSVSNDVFPLQLRQQTRNLAESASFTRSERAEQWPARQTAVVVCDVWDLHHCRNAVRRLEEFLPRLNSFLTAARERGAIIIHAPSDCMDAYRDHPARQRAQTTPRVSPLPQDIEFWCSRIPAEESAVYPLDQSDGGEDDDPAEHAAWAAHLKALGRNPAMPWKQQSDRITIDGERDYISDRGDEVWNILAHRGIQQVMLVGVHTNMCVLGRPFGLRQLVRHGKRVVLVRDLTDTMYNPQRWPFVDHFTGTDLIVSHIERFVCPTITSDQLLGGEPFRFHADVRAVRDVTSVEHAMPPAGGSKAGYWSLLELPGNWVRAASRALQNQGAVAWYRCTVRLPRDWVVPEGLTLSVPPLTEPIRAWCNGRALEVIPGERAVFRVPADCLVPDDANLLVLRVQHHAKDETPHVAPRLSRNDQILSLSGRWQFRLGDDPSWSNMPLPARFGTGTDVLFEPASP